jgi:hypothetical protein
MTYANQPRYYGLYRGVVGDTNDPAGANRIRARVPQVLGGALSGWAWPCWPVGDLSILPEDRLPPVGQGVWIMFEGGDPSKPVWVGVF